MKIRLNYFLLLPFFFSCTEKESLNFQYADWVDTKIGAIDTRGSNCVIGPRLPYGSISPSPQTEDGGWMAIIQTSLYVVLDNCMLAVQVGELTDIS